MNVIMLIIEPTKRNEMAFLNMSSKSIGLASSKPDRKLASFDLSVFNPALSIIPFIMLKWIKKPFW